MIMETWQIILAIFIVILSIVLPIYYSRKKKTEDKTKESEAIIELGKEYRFDPTLENLFYLEDIFGKNVIQI